MQAKWQKNSNTGSCSLYLQMKLIQVTECSSQISVHIYGLKWAKCDTSFIYIKKNLFELIYEGCLTFPILKHILIAAIMQHKSNQKLCWRHITNSKQNICTLVNMKYLCISINFSHPALHHTPIDPLALLDWTNHLSDGYKEGTHQGSFLSWYIGGGMNFPRMSEQLYVFKQWLKMNFSLKILALSVCCSH